MPHIRVSTGIMLHYTEFGDGPPLMLLEGIQGSWVWHPTIPVLSQLFHVILLDNRGTGQSDKPQPPYSVAEMAGETAEVIRALGSGPTDIMGMSLGGSIAQEVAFAHPALVRSLVLVGASPGGLFQFPTCAYAAQLETQVPQLSIEENLRRTLPVAVSPYYRLTHPAELERMIELAGSHPTPLYARQALWNAGAFWPGNAGRTAAATIPMLALNGVLDLVSPVANAFWLAALHPECRLLLFPGSGHLCNWEYSNPFNEAVIEFLTRP